MLPPYLDQLGFERQEVFKKLKRFSKNFTLAGGTAIMLQIGHRMSFDFDCFGRQKLSETLPRKVRDVFGKFIYLKLRTSEQITFHTEKGVEITFVYHPYKPLREPIETDSITLFHLDDLAANKAYTIGRRGVWRDYVDLFFLLKWKLYDLQAIIALAEKKFTVEFSEKLFLAQLTYFDDIVVMDTDFLKESYTPSEIQRFLEKEVRDYLARILP